MLPCGTPNMTGTQSDQRLQHIGIDLGENWIARKVESW